MLHTVCVCVYSVSVYVRILGATYSIDIAAVSSDASIVHIIFILLLYAVYESSVCILYGTCTRCVMSATT